MISAIENVDRPALVILFFICPFEPGFERTALTDTLQITWKGYTEQEWVPESRMGSYETVLDKFMKQQKPVVLVKDMQKELGLPELQQDQPPEMYRARQIHLYNLGVYNCCDEQMYCYVWDEFTAKRTTDDVISALWLHLQKYVDSRKELILWSDNCVAQNTRYVKTNKYFLNNTKQTAGRF